MERTQFTLLTVLAIGFTGSTATAQLESTGGPTAVLATGVSLHHDATPTSPDELFITPPPPLGPAVVHTGGAPPNSPDFSLAAMFPAYVDYIEIDAYASGNAIIPRPAVLGQPLSPPAVLGGNRWLEVVVSVDNEADGLPGSFIAQRNLLTGGRNSPGADLIGLVLDGSQGIAPGLVGTTTLEQRAERFGFTNGEDIDAFDFGMGAIHFAESAGRVTFFVNDTECYFSLSPQCVPLVNAIAVGNSTTFATLGADADPAAVYRIEWDGSAWSTPEVYRTALDLGLDPLVDNLDALTVDPQSECLVFSTQIKTGISQLRFLAYDSLASPSVLHLEDLGDGMGNTITSRIGSNDETDDIDAACIVDPATPHEPYFTTFGTHLGTPLEPALPGPQVGLSVTRSAIEKRDHIHLRVSAVAPIDLKSSWVHFLIQLGPDYQVFPTAPYAPEWLWFATESAIDDSNEVQLMIPNGAATEPVPVLFQCLVQDAASPFAAVSWANALLMN